MIEFSPNDLATHTAHVQRLAQNRPVMIVDDNKKQVLMTYDEYLKLGGAPQTEFKSFYDVFFGNMPPELADALAELDDDDEELELSSISANKE